MTQDEVAELTEQLANAGVDGEGENAENDEGEGVKEEEEVKELIDEKGLDLRSPDFHVTKKFSAKTTQILSSEGENREVYCCAFEHQDRFVAAGCGDGSISVFNTLSGKSASNINYNNDKEEDSRCMQIEWNPCTVPSEGGSRTQNYLTACYSDGTINSYFMPVGKVVSSIKEEGNEIFSISYNREHSQFISGGMDTVVRLYDDEKKELICDLKSIDSHNPGHANRIFAVKFHPQDSNMALSGGWDRTIQIYDIRSGGPVSSIFGPELSGNALDAHGYNVVTGSYRNKDVLQMFDVRTTKLVQNIEWEYGSTINENSNLNCVAMNHSAIDPGNVIIAGGKSNELKIF